MKQKKLTIGPNDDSRRLIGGRGNRSYKSIDGVHHPNSGKVASTNPNPDLFTYLLFFCCKVYTFIRVYNTVRRPVATDCNRFSNGFQLFQN